MTSSNDHTPAEKFTIFINYAMMRGIKQDVDPDVMARICLNTARELYDHYGAGDDHSNYLTYVTDAQFEQAEIEELLDHLEGSWNDDT